MLLLLVVALSLDAESGLFENCLVALKIEIGFDQLLVLSLLFLAIKDVLWLLARVHQVLGKEALVDVTLRIIDGLLHDGLDAQPVVWVLRPEVKLEIADLSFSTLLLCDQRKMNLSDILVLPLHYLKNEALWPHLKKRNGKAFKKSWLESLKRGYCSKA